MGIGERQGYPPIKPETQRIMKSTENTDEKQTTELHEVGSGASTCSAMPWINALAHPLAEMHDGKFKIKAGYEDLRLFAIILAGGDWEYHVGSIAEDGGIVDIHGNCVGRESWNIDYYINLNPPAVPVSILS